ncbi:CHASE domain-containing protein [Aequorivita viscosa]|nr:CHASE domain-containing protein [Aequorivita viscosa]
MKIVTIKASWLVLLIGLIVTTIAATYIKRETDIKEEAAFKFESENLAGRVETRLQAHALLLRSCAAFFTASDYVSRNDWRVFIEQYNIDENLPGVMGLGFSLKIPSDELQKHIQQIKAQGFTDYVVWPEYNRDIYTSIIYQEPFSPKDSRIFGFDMLTDPVRKKAMYRARDEGLAALSGKVQLEAQQVTQMRAGNIMFVAVYKKGASINTVEERRAALKGWVYSACRMDDLMSGILPVGKIMDKKNGLYLKIYDGETVSPEALLFQLHQADTQEEASKNQFTFAFPIDFNGHNWILVFRQNRGTIFNNYIGAWSVFGGGIVISILSFLLARSLISTKYKAQKIAESLTEELKESKNKLHKIMEVSPVPMILNRINDGVVLMANEAFGKLFNISASQTIGQKLPDFYPNIADRDALLNTVITKGFVDKAELQLKKTDGTLFWCAISLKLLTLNEGPVLISAFHDVSKRKEAEVEITKHREQLEKMVAERTEKLTISEQKLRQSIQEISDYKQALDASSSVTISDSDGIIREVNANFCELSKYSRDEVIGRSHKISNSGYHPKSFFTNLWTTISEGEIWRGEIKNKAKDGSYYWVDTTIIPFLDTTGKPYQYVSIRIDITNKKSVEADLIKAKQAADAANLAKTQFLANMSHEIRTPMNAVIGFSELLAKSVEDEKQRSQVESIRSSGQNLLKIINDILDLSKIEAGKIDIVTTPIKLSNLLYDIEDVFAEKVKSKQITLDIDYENVFEKTLLLDEVRIRQILFNLIGNAVKFTDEGFVSLSIDSKQNSAATHVDLTIIVKDTGIGIPVAEQESIFDPFNQPLGQNFTKYGGSGLGLSITKKLINKMNGSISLNSEVGEGSTFRVTLPNIQISDTEIAVKEKAFDASTILFKPATLLIVDDHEENQKLIIDLLEDSPLTILQAKNGEEAVALANKHLPDLILMDLRMPIMDGYEATKILKTHEDTKSIPIMAITASIKNLKERNKIEREFDEYLLKPLNIAQFFTKLKKHLKFEEVSTDGETKINGAKPQKYKLSEELKPKIPQFIKVLEGDLMAEYQKVNKNQVINEIEKFAKDLLAISQEMQCEALIEYSRELLVYSENFDFQNLLYSLREFPELVAWVKAETNHN